MARLVYSTGSDDAGASRRSEANEEPRSSVAPATQQVRVRRERGGRGGKTVSVAAPLALTRDDALELLRRLKRLCGSGGTIRPVEGPAFALEIQGDHVERLVAELKELGYPAKRAGG